MGRPVLPMSLLTSTVTGRVLQAAPAAAAAAAPAAAAAAAAAPCGVSCYYASRRPFGGPFGALKRGLEPHLAAASLGGGRFPVAAAAAAPAAGCLSPFAAAAAAAAPLSVTSLSSFQSARFLIEIKFKKVPNKDTDQIPFKVLRTPSGNLPVYSRIRKHGTAVTTIVRHALGDVK
ncbi:Conserved protein, related, partial [Eimeria tenella]